VRTTTLAEILAREAVQGIDRYQASIAKARNTTSLQRSPLD